MKEAVGRGQWGFGLISFESQSFSRTGLRYFVARELFRILGSMSEC